MSDTVFRSAPEVTSSEPDIPTPDREPNKVGGEVNIEDLAPIEDGEEAVLKALGIDDLSRNLPPDDADNLKEVEHYIQGILSKKGVEPTQSAFNRTLDDLKGEMGLDPNAEASVVLDRIGGVVKAWKEISFIKDPREKRSLFMKLARMQSSTDMNKAVYQAMEDHKIWV